MVEMQDISSDQVAKDTASKHIAGKRSKPERPGDQDLDASMERVRRVGCRQPIYGQLYLPGRVFIGNHVSECERRRGVSGIG